MTLHHVKPWRQGKARITRSNTCAAGVYAWMIVHETFQLNQSQHTLSLHANGVAGRVWSACCNQRYCRQLHLPGLCREQCCGDGMPAFCSLLEYYWPAIPRNHACNRSTLSNGRQFNPLRCRHRPSSTMRGRLLRTIGGVVRVRTKATVTSVGSALVEPADCIVQLSESQLFAHFLTK